MTISNLIKLLELKVTELSRQRATVAAFGDIASMLRIDSEIAETEATLSTLRAMAS
jgi:hypothetical protein